MSLSIFSNQELSDGKNIADDAEISKSVRTMEDDFSDIKNQNKQKSVLAQKNLEKTKDAPAVKPRQNIPSTQSINPFGKEAQTNDVVQKNTKNPFEEGVLQTKKDVPQQKNTKSELILTGLPLPKKTIVVSQSQEKNNLLLIMGVVVLIVAFILGGAYYYLFVVKKEVVSPIPIQSKNNVEVIPEKVVQALPKEPIYSLDKPNYLSINTEAISPEEIQKTFSTVASRVKEAKISQPVEFLITDQNNNPLAFSRFATLLKIDLALVSAQIDDSFSLYVYNDDGSMRIGLDLTIKDQEIMLPALSKIENTLPSTFQMLLLESNITLPKTIDFKSNVYTPPVLTEQQFTIHYANIDIPRKVSIDYTVANNHWYIGTSRSTLLALLDMIKK